MGCGDRDSVPTWGPRAESYAFSSETLSYPLLEGGGPDHRGPGLALQLLLVQWVRRCFVSSAARLVVKAER